MNLRPMTRAEQAIAEASGWTCARCSKPAEEIITTSAVSLCASHAKLTRTNAQRQAEGLPLIQADQWDREHA
jgi:hypothetical protein